MSQARTLLLHSTKLGLGTSGKPLLTPFEIDSNKWITKSITAGFGNIFIALKHRNTKRDAVWAEGRTNLSSSSGFIPFDHIFLSSTSKEDPQYPFLLPRGTSLSGISCTLGGTWFKGLRSNDDSDPTSSRPSTSKRLPWLATCGNLSNGQLFHRFSSSSSSGGKNEEWNNYSGLGKELEREPEREEIKTVEEFRERMIQSKVRMVPLPTSASTSTSQEVDSRIGIGERYFDDFDLVTGFEHAHLLVSSSYPSSSSTASSPLSSHTDIYSIGSNSDGQSGIGISPSKAPFLSNQWKPISFNNNPSSSTTFQPTKIFAGADTSACMGEAISNPDSESATQQKQKVFYTWGNAEYAQTFHSKVEPLIVNPTQVDLEFLNDTDTTNTGGPVYERKDLEVKEFACGGSFGLILDSSGSVYSCGYGATGQGSSLIQSSPLSRSSPPSSSPTVIIKPTKIPNLKGITRIRAAWGYAIAIDDISLKIYIWGLNTPDNRLLSTQFSSPFSSSLGDPNNNNVLEPFQIQGCEKWKEDGWAIGEVALGSDGVWVLLKEREQSRA